MVHKYNRERNEGGELEEGGGDSIGSHSLIPQNTLIQTVFIM